MTTPQTHDPNRLTLRNAVGAVLDFTLDVADWCCRHFGNIKNEGLSDHFHHPLDEREVPEPIPTLFD